MTGKSKEHIMFSVHISGLPIKMAHRILVTLKGLKISSSMIISYNFFVYITIRTFIFKYFTVTWYKHTLLRVYNKASSGNLPKPFPVTDLCLHALLKHLLRLFLHIFTSLPDEYSVLFYYLYPCQINSMVEVVCETESTNHCLDQSLKV